MWNFSLSKAIPPPKDVNNLQHLHDDNDINVDFNEEDLQDPELLAELHGLLAAQQPPQTKPSSKIITSKPESSIYSNKPSDNPLAIDAVLASIPQNDDIKVEFSEKDMEDPELLGELHAISGENPINEHVDDSVLTDSLANLNIVSEKLPESQSNSPIETPQSIQLKKLNDRKIEYKKSALKYHKENNPQKAREHLVISKQIQEQIDKLSNGFAVYSEFKLPASPSQPSAAAPEVTSPLNIIDPIQETPKIIEPPKVKIAEMPIIKPRIVENNMNSATQQLSPSGIPQELSESKDIFCHLIQTIESHIKSCTTISAYFFKSGKKDMALTFHKRKKAYILDLETLKALSVTANSIVPSFFYNTITYEVENIFPELGLNELEICILKAYDLENLNLKDINSSVTFVFDRLFENSDNPENKGETIVLKNSSAPEYSFSKKLKIERNRKFERFLENRKISFELMHHSTQFMVMTKKTVVAKAQIKLDTLLTRCEIHEAIQLYDPTKPKKPTGCKLEIKIRLRTPATQPEITKKQENWLQIDFSKGVSNSITNVEITDVATEPSISMSKPETLSPNSDSVDTPKQKAEIKALSSPNPTSASDEVEDLLLQFKSPDSIISNQVLEYEHKQLCEQILSLKNNVPEELVDLKNSYEIKMNLLVSMIQMGNLTLHDYIEKVKQSINDTKKLALTFKKAGKLQETKMAMIRLKLMAKEVEEVEER